MGATAGDSFGKDLALRGIGALADLGDNASFGLATRAGNWLAGNGFNKNNPDGTAPSATTGPTLRATAPTNTAPAATNSIASLPGADATMPGQDPNRVTLRGMAGSDVAGAPGVSKFTQGGKTLYSNVTDGNGGNGGSNPIGITPGMDPALIKQTLTNPDGSTWSAADNSRMAANLRDGVDPYRGTSRGAAAGGAGADPGIGNFGHGSWVRQQMANQTNQTTLRGQTLQSQDNRYGHELSTEVSRNRLRYDMNKDQRDFQTGRNDKNFEQAQTAQKNLTDEIGSYLPPGPDGKPDTARAAQFMGAMNAHVSERMGLLQKHLQLNPGDKQAASELEGLQKRGVAQLGPDTKRKFIEGQMAADVANSTATGGMTPWGTAAVDSAAPITSLRRQSALIGHDYVSNRGDVIPGRYIDKSNSTLGFGGRPNRNFDNLKLRDQQ